MSRSVATRLALAGSLLFPAITAAGVNPAGRADMQISAAPSTFVFSVARNQPPPDEPVASAPARSLFDPQRRLAQIAAGAISNETGLTDVRLTGIVTGLGQRIAIFSAPGEAPRALSEGQSISGWRIDSITSQDVLVRGPGGAKVLRPEADAALTRTGSAQMAPPTVTVPAGEHQSFLPIPAAAAQPMPAPVRRVVPAQSRRDEE